MMSSWPVSLDITATVRVTLSCAVNQVNKKSRITIIWTSRITIIWTEINTWYGDDDALLYRYLSDSQVWIYTIASNVLAKLFGWYLWLNNGVVHKYHHKNFPTSNDPAAARFDARASNSLKMIVSWNVHGIMWVVLWLLSWFRKNILTVGRHD